MTNVEIISTQRPNKILLWVLALLVLAGVFRSLVPSEEPLPERPDILLITVDTLRADRLGYAGHGPAETPHIDRLAREGTVFRQATTPFPRTTPALASLLSGLWPQNHGSREVGQKMAKDSPFLTLLLDDLGYHTVGLTANGAAGAVQGFARGFDAFATDKDLPNRRATAVTDHILERLAEVPEDEPLFLWVHYVDPHYPYSPPKPWRDTADPEPCRALMQEANDRSKVGWVFSNRDGRSSVARDSCLDLYDAEIAYTDHEIGRLIETLEGMGRFEEALTVFTADHGENLGEEGLFFQHGPNLHDASLRIPLIFRGPGIEGQVDEGVARLEDVMPTLLTLLRLPKDRWPEMDGQDLSHRLRTRRLLDRKDDRLTLAESGSALLLHSYRYLHSGRQHELHCLNAERFSLCGKPDEEPALYDHEADPDLTTDLSADFPEEKRQLMAAREIWPAEQARERSVRGVRFKLVERPRLRGGYRSSLYDLENDPEAVHDVGAEFPEEKERLQASLDRWTASLPSQKIDKRTEDQLETLRALGYID